MKQLDRLEFQAQRSSAANDDMVETVLGARDQIKDMLHDRLPPAEGKNLY